MENLTFEQHRQIELENEYNLKDIAVNRTKLTKEAKAGNIEHNGVGYRLMKIIMDDMVDNYPEYVNNKLKSKVAFILDIIGKENVAALTASVVIKCATERRARQSAIEQLGTTLRDAALEEDLKNSMDKEAKEDFERELGYTKAKDVQNMLVTFAFKYNVDFEDEVEFIILAQKLIAQVVERTGLFTVSASTHTDSTLTEYVFSAQAHTKIEGLNEFIAEHSVKFRPLVCKPRPWTSPISGGFYTDTYKMNLVKPIGSYAEVAQYHVDLGNTEGIENFMNSVNKIQETGFVINKSVLKLATEIVNLDGGICDVPSSETVDINKDMTPTQRYLAIMEEKSRASKERAIKGALLLSEEFKSEAAFYMAYNADFRGRLYCSCSELNPQGSDLQKALLLFSEKQELGKTGLRWLKIHAANCYAVNSLDKAPMSKRIAWVNKHMNLIRLIAKGDVTDPKFIKAIKKAESPFLFFAVAQELVQVSDMARQDVPTFKSNIPVSIDGSNNGLQHYAALLRSTTLAEKVNLHVLGDNDTPSDVYMKVADGATSFFKVTSAKYIAEKCTTEKFNVTQKTVKELIKAWMNAAPATRRKTVKRPTMTQAYSVTKIGARNQMYEDAVDKYTLSDSAKEAFKSVIGMAFEAGLAEHCSAATAGMDFLKQTINAVNNKFQWTTPMGFLVKQAYKKDTTVKLSSKVCGKSMSIKYKKATTNIDTRKQVAAIAPNFIHSHDASHMLKVVHDLDKDAAFTPAYFMIHDSFGTYAGQSEQLSNQVRRSFVDMYTTDIFAEFKKQAIAQGADIEKLPELPPTPEEDIFDLNDVIKATYFFC